jgi:hypothetical protein
VVVDSVLELELQRQLQLLLVDSVSGQELQLQQLVVVVAVLGSVLGQELQLRRLVMIGKKGLPRPAMSLVVKNPLIAKRQPPPLQTMFLAVGPLHCLQVGLLLLPEQLLAVMIRKRRPLRLEGLEHRHLHQVLLVGMTRALRRDFRLEEPMPKELP